MLGELLGVGTASQALCQPVLVERLQGARPCSNSGARRAEMRRACLEGTTSQWPERQTGKRAEQSGVQDGVGRGVSGLGRELGQPF